MNTLIRPSSLRSCLAAIGTVVTCFEIDALSNNGRITGVAFCWPDIRSLVQALTWLEDSALYATWSDPSKARTLGIDHTEVLWSGATVRNNMNAFFREFTAASSLQAATHPSEDGHSTSRLAPSFKSISSAFVALEQMISTPTAMDRQDEVQFMTAITRLICALNCLKACFCRVYGDRDSYARRVHERAELARTEAKQARAIFIEARKNGRRKKS